MLRHPSYPHQTKALRLLTALNAHYAAAKLARRRAQSEDFRRGVQFRPIPSTPRRLRTLRVQEAG